MTQDGVLDDTEKSVQALGESTPVNLYGIRKSTQQTRDRSRSRTLIFSWEGLGATTITMEMVGEAMERVKGPGEG